MTDKPGPFLFDAARRELVEESSIDPDVLAERGYTSRSIAPAQATNDHANDSRRCRYRHGRSKKMHISLDC